MKNEFKMYEDGIWGMHLEESESTQTQLKSWVESEQSQQQCAIVTTIVQPGGMGRLGRKWDCLQNSLAFSFCASAHPKFMLSSLEVGVLLLQFLKGSFSGGRALFLKWPNDLLCLDGEEYKKCGGILITVTGERLIVGIGLNLYPSPHDNDVSTTSYTSPLGFIFDSESEFVACNHSMGEHGKFQHTIPLQFYRYYLKNRFCGTEDLIQQWCSYCAHLNRVVSFSCEEAVPLFRGIFMGLGPQGEAVVRDLRTGISKHFISGSLAL
ncbi:MAG: hypothetical protein HQK52_03725 [Oligoflexia bacterium]|nr:hypothetical protein [Oligoflexia bacterium]